MTSFAELNVHRSTGLYSILIYRSLRRELA